MVQYFTKQGLQKLKDELNYLKTTKNKEIVKLIAEAAAFGDLTENAAYHDARDKMSFLRMRITELEGAINEAIVKEKDETGKVQVGSFVVITISEKPASAKGFGEARQNYQIVAPSEANILQNKISYQSPLGQKLIGHKINEEFDFQAGSKKVKVKIIAIH